MQSSFKVRKGVTGSGRKLLQPNSTPSTSTLSIPDPVSLSPAIATETYSKEFLNQLKATTLSAPLSTEISIDNNEFDSLTQSKFALYNSYSLPSSSTPSSTAQKIPLIPTSSTINSARESRERLRAQGGRDNEEGDGYIGFEVVESGGTVRLGEKGKGRESRLVRDEDDLGDGDEGTSPASLSVILRLTNPWRRYHLVQLVQISSSNRKTRQRARGSYTQRINERIDRRRARRGFPHSESRGERRGGGRG